MKLCFLDAFVQKLNQKFNSSGNVTNDAQFSYNFFTKQSLCLQIHMKNTHGHHDEKRCCPPNCRYHISLIGDIKEFLYKLDSFCFDHVDCL